MLVSTNLTPLEYILLLTRTLLVFYTSFALLVLSLPVYLLSPLFPSLYSDTVLPTFRHVWFVTVLTILPPLPPVLLSLPPGGIPKDAILTPNHQLDLDFLLIWLAVGLSSNDWFGDVRIVLKESVANIPILGTGIKMFGFLPVVRDARLDLPNIEGWSREGRRIIFPEGTTLNTKDLESCKQYSQGKQGFGWFGKQSNVLTPRIKGVRALVGSKPSSSSVVDVTAIYGNYKGECPTYEMGYDRDTEVLPSFKKVLSGLEIGWKEIDQLLLKLNELTACMNGGSGAESRSKFSASTTKTMALVRFGADDDRKDGDVGKWLVKAWQEKSEFIETHRDGSWVDSTSVEGSLARNGGDWVKQYPARLRQPILVLGLCWTPLFCLIAYPIVFFLGGWILLALAGLKKFASTSPSPTALAKTK